MDRKNELTDRLVTSKEYISWHNQKIEMEQKREVILNSEYIKWLEHFTSLNENGGFVCDSILQYVITFPLLEEQKANIEKLHYLYNSIEQYAHKNNISPIVSDSDGIYYNVIYNNFIFRIGKTSFYYLQRLEDSENIHLIDFDDVITENKEDKHEFEMDEWKIAAIEQAKGKRNLHHKLNYDIPQLSEEELKSLNILLSSRQKELERYMEVSDQISELINLRNKLYSEFIAISSDVCALQGHRLLEKPETDYNSYIDEGSVPVYYRKCCICGKKIKENELMNNDVIVRKLVPNKKENNN